MVSHEVLQEIRAILVDIAKVDPAQVTPAKSLVADLAIDSVTMVKIVVAVEDRFGAIVPDEEWSQFSTVGDLVAHLERTGGIAPAGPARP
jgi:acyl carrier protein